MDPLPAGSIDLWARRWLQLAAAIRPVVGPAEDARLMAELRSLDRSRVLGFVNAHAMNTAAADAFFFEALMAADILLRDGSGMALFYRSRDLEPGLNMNGTDLIPRLLAAFRGCRVAFWGTEEPYLTAAADRAEANFGVKVVSRENGFHNHDFYIELARQQSLDLIVLGMGMPKQELLARELRPAAGHALIVCGGAIIDFLGEKVSRAPGWMRRHGLEWAYRLCQEPGRLYKRYLIGNALFLWRSLRLQQGKTQGLTPFRENSSMSINRIALLLAGMMCAASVGAMMAKPTAKIAEQGPQIVLEAMVPQQFGDWRLEPQKFVPIINPQTQQLLDKLYSQILSRTYINGDGYRIMVSIAYGGDQREGMEAHKPEVCYPAQGFSLLGSKPADLATPYGVIPARRLLAAMGGRREPITYWYTVGNRSVGSSLQKKLVEMSFGLTGRIPDGLLFRISSIDPDTERGYRMQEQFIRQLLESVPPSDRLRLSGLGTPTGS